MTSPVITVPAPASKSMSHRAVIAAALARGRSTLRNVLDSDDLTRTMDCLTACGARFERSGDGLAVLGLAGRPLGGEDRPVDLDVHESGTTCRLMTAVVAAGQGRFRVHGAPRMHERPIGSLAEALASQEVDFHWEGRPGYPPFVLVTSGLPGGELAVDVGESSQYLSGLLLAAPCARSETSIVLAGRKVVSWPYVALTLQTLEDFGIDFEVQVPAGEGWEPAAWRTMERMEPGCGRFLIRPGEYQAGDRTVEGDWSNASYFLAAGAVGPEPVRVDGLRRDSLQGDRAILDILARMGARIAWEGNAVTVSPPRDGRLLGLDADMSACPDIVPTVAVVAALARTPTRITGVAHLRIKECDRLAAPARELAKVGARVEVGEDHLVVTPVPLPKGRTVEFTTYGDHRMAMSLAVLSRAGITPRFDNPGCVAKSFPGFWEAWARLEKGRKA